MHMEISNATNTKNSQESGDPQSSATAEVKRCQGVCADCAVRLFMSTDRTKPKARQIAEHLFVNRMTGITTPVSRYLVTPKERHDELDSYTQKVLGCNQLNGDRHAVLDRVAGAHHLLQIAVPQVISDALQQSVASSQ